MLKLGIVIIGLNEGVRLERCLDSLRSVAAAKVYVDSGSTDGSVELAVSAGCSIVHLDVANTRFNCARARNAGFRRIVNNDSTTELVQFVDADCELAPGWLERGTRAFEADPRLAITCGHLREKYRNETIYGRLCDMEWDGPVGDIETCGGIAMMRVGPFGERQGFNEALACGEEYELCMRLRADGYRVVRLDDEMALHDAAMKTFVHWWGRAANYGYGYAAAVFGGFADPRKLRHVLRAIAWAGVLPVVAFAGLLVGRWFPVARLLTVAVALIYLASASRIYRIRRRRGNGARDALLYSIFCILSKWPQLAGQIRFLLLRKVAR